MTFEWDFSLSNGFFTVLVVGVLNWYLYRRICREFNADIRKLVTAPVAETQLSEQLSRIEEKIARLIARDEQHHEEIDRLRDRDQPPG